MIISSVHIKKYCIPFKQPLRLFSHEWKCRNIIYLEFETNTGTKGIGEISPLPEFHPWDTKEIWQNLLQSARMLKQHSLPESVSIGQNIGPDFFSNIPIVDFGIQMALMSLYIMEKPGFIPLVKKVLRVNGLIDSLEQLNHDIIHQKINEGWRTFKVKVARQSPDNEKKNLLELIHSTPDFVQFRLDANGRWHAEEAIAFCKDLPLNRIEYIEEPVRTVQDLAIFYQETKMPVALDESLHSIRISELGRLPGVRAAVIKPEFIGNMTNLSFMINKLKQYGIYTVFSSSFYSPLGTMQIAYVAQLFSPDDVAHGLDTLSYFQLSPNQTFDLTGGQLRLIAPEELIAFGEQIEEFLIDEIII